MVVKIMVPFWVPIIIRHLIFRVIKTDYNLDNHPSTWTLDVLPIFGICVISYLRRTSRHLSQSARREDIQRDAAKELKLSHYRTENLVFNMYPCYGVTYF